MTLKKIILSVAILSAFSVSAFAEWKENPYKLRGAEIQKGDFIGNYNSAKAYPELFKYVVVPAIGKVVCIDTIENFNKYNNRNDLTLNMILDSFNSSSFYTNLRNNQTFSYIDKGNGIVSYSSFFSTLQDCQKEADLLNSNIQK